MDGFVEERGYTYYSCTVWTKYIMRASAKTPLKQRRYSVLIKVCSAEAQLNSQGTALGVCVMGQ